MKRFILTWRIEIFCTLLTVASVTGVWMKALEKQVQHKGMAAFNIMLLEKPANTASLKTTLDTIEATQATPLVQKNLQVDFAFMPAVYMGIAFWLLLIGRTMPRYRKLLILLALLQALPWICDIIENILLLRAIKDPLHQLDMNLNSFKTMVNAKFIIAFGAAGIALLACISKPFQKRG